MKISKSALEDRAARRESKPAEEGRRSMQMRERRMGAERGGEAVGAQREEDGENLQLSVGGEEGVETGGGGEAVGAEEREGDGSREIRGGGRCRERGSWGKSVQVGAHGEEGVGIGGGGEAVGAEAVRGVQRRAVRGVQRRCVRAEAIGAWRSGTSLSDGVKT
ncbi:hypothetical protein Scep_010007 [Stephania cephalantha]|uniref:Uncharacterized protein n=1 Tax=Stephania cephalantha TaxID=152367 RepID=A0AAP0JUM7_9MAGN